MAGLAQLSVALLVIGVIVVIGVGLLLLMMMDSGPDWITNILHIIWYIFGWVCLIVGGILGVIALVLIAFFRLFSRRTIRWSVVWVTLIAW